MRGMRALVLTALIIIVLTTGVRAAGPLGYYRQPALWRDTIVFVAEGDIWKVSVSGGVATRLTSHPSDETYPQISPDGQTIAFVGQYEGPREVYTIPIFGGLPTRRTYDGAAVAVSGWTRDGKILFSTDAHATLPGVQLAMLDISRSDAAGVPTLLPLAQAADGCLDESGNTLFFTRLQFQGSHTKRYKGGTAQNIWRFGRGEAEAGAMTADYTGTSRRPMYWNGRVYFITDRDGTMNIWSMKPNGADLRQHTRHVGWDVISPSMWEGRIVYQLGADIHLYEVAAAADRIVPITLSSDLDQTREHWIKRPMEYVSSAHISPDGDRVVLTARGQVFVAPHRQGRLVEATRQQGARYRNARFLPDGKSLAVLSDESGEVEFWKLPANGIGTARQLTADGTILRWDGIPSPDGRYLAHHDKNQRLFLLDVERKQNRTIDEAKNGDITDLVWSLDSKWLAYVTEAENQFRQIRLFSLASGKVTRITSDRFESYSPAWSADGKWLYFLSDRNLQTSVASPWGSYQPEPYLDRRSQLFVLSLRSDAGRPPFAPADELQGEKQEPRSATTAPTTAPSTQPAGRSGLSRLVRRLAGGSSGTQIDLDGIQARITALPLPPGNYRDLVANDRGLFWLASAGRTSLVGAVISPDGVEMRTIMEDVRSFELSQNGRKMLVRKGDGLFIIDAAVMPADLTRKDVDLSRWALSVIPREEWRQMFTEAWRLERDYFYDRHMHGVDWKAMHEKYCPLVERVTTRGELSDLIAQMVGELSALHTFVRGGDSRSGDDMVAPAFLGAELVRDDAAGGYRVQHIYQSDPDEPARCSPLAKMGVNVKEGDVIEMINGEATLSVPDIGLLLRRQADQPVRMRLKAAGGARDVMVTPISATAAADLRYHEWEYTRRLAVERMSKGQVGYVHLRAMGGANYTEWAKGFFPVWNRQGLIIDVRHNNGGNIDSWILNRLLRKAWFYWSHRVNETPNWNMQYAFRGHVVVLCDERTASDGEAFTEGVKRLKLGTVIGTRTWGGEIWLSSSNVLVDRGIATAAEFGVYGPDGHWLIEGHGVDPDIVVDNLPHATFKGEDAQLKAAVEYLEKKVRENPIETPKPPQYPDKSFHRSVAENPQQ